MGSAQVVVIVLLRSCSWMRAWPMWNKQSKHTALPRQVSVLVSVSLSVAAEAAVEEARVGERESDVRDWHAQRHAALPLLACIPQPDEAHVGQRAARRTHLRRCQRFEGHLPSNTRPGHSCGVSMHIAQIIQSRHVI